MKITKTKVKKSNAPEFCYTCGKTLNEGDKYYLLSLGTFGSTFELCQCCLRKISKRTNNLLTK